ncbi:MAG: hypothetical protein M1816_004650 [Peltula sp. TS41687]|nr:MAG: hypothetical protein M1816_004650 [Peltula sp. TS41687]
MSQTISFKVQQRHAKKVKDMLDREGLLDRSHKIEKENTFCQIPTNIAAEGERGNVIAQETKATIARHLGLCENTDEISWTVGSARPRRSSRAAQRSTDSSTARAVTAWLEELSSEDLASLNVSSQELLSALPEMHARYPPLLILSKTAFTPEPWRRVMQSLESHVMQDLYREITMAFDVTHLAVNGAIPLTLNNGADSPTTAAAAAGRLNILRSPCQFQPLYGDFGERMLSRPPTTTETRRHFAQALWVCTKQNGIFQCWAPLYTMFSQGNVTEKQRLLNTLQDNCHDINPGESAAVDLYAGIGYFAFSYAKAGFKKVVCWELNPWSVEGLRRGAEMNRWKTTVVSVRSGDGIEPDDSSGRLDLQGDGDGNTVVFEEDNVHALRRIQAMRRQLPPVRHVNCGFLPSSKGVWRDALAILDPRLGGWIHAHENVANHERDRREAEMLEDFRQYAAPRRVVSWQLRNVKSYAPGITHCVMDVQISPDMSIPL